MRSVCATVLLALTAAFPLVAAPDTVSFVGWGRDDFGQASPPPDARGGIKGIAATSYATFALKEDGAVIGWGEEPCYDALVGIPLPVPRGLSGVASLATGPYTVVALRSDGTIVEWGYTWSYAAQSHSPSVTGAIAVAAGDTYNLALRSDGTVAAWASDWSFTGVPDDRLVPAGLYGAKAIAASGYHNAALLADGTVVSWDVLQGAPGSVPWNIPEGVTDVQAIAVTYARTLALRGDGTVVTWGSDGATTILDVTNVIAIFGNPYYDRFAAIRSDGTFVIWGQEHGFDAIPPQGYMPPPPDLAGVTALALGAAHTVALKDDGTIVGWGDNRMGQADVPRGIDGAMALAAGDYNTLLLRADGTVFGWGHSVWYENQVPPGVSDAVAIVAGHWSSFALRSDGSVVEWGFGSLSPSHSFPLRAVAIAGLYSSDLIVLLEDGTVVFPNSPYPIGGLTNSAAIAMFADHYLVANADGTVVAGTMDGSPVPPYREVPPGLSDVVAVAMGNSHSVALRSDGTVVAWGSNDSGQTDVPVGLSGVIAIDAGLGHTLALKDDGTVVAWGANDYGQSSVPPGLDGVTAISAGWYHSVALRSSVTLAVATVGTGAGRVTSTPPGIDCGETCTAEVTAWRTVTLTAIPSAESVFMGWDVCPDLGTCAVKMDVSKTVTATFALGDRTPPVVSVPASVHATASTASGAVVTFEATAFDAVSGNITPVCTPGSGAMFAPGTTHVTCTATDAAGNTGTASFDVTVTFAWGGIAPPVNPDGSSVFKLGRTVPLKFQLIGASAPIANLTATLTVRQVADGVLGSVEEPTSTSAADFGNRFRYDAVGGTYIFNLATGALSAGTYQARIDMNDGIERVALFSLRQ